jgi:hypothetical protein
MEDDDFDWAARLMERRREKYAAYSPAFWRPATGILERHAQFMRAFVARAGAVALRSEHGFAVGGVEALIVPAPPVYDPGGLVCLLGDLQAERAGDAVEAAARYGAVLAIVQRDRSPASAPESEPGLEVVGFHNPSEFYDGVPAGT